MPRSRARRRRARASAPPCCRASRRTGDAGARSGRRRGRPPTGYRLRIRCGRPGRRRARGGYSPALHPEALDDAAVLQMLFDDLVDVGLIDVRVPDRIGVDHDAGTFLAAIEAARLIYADLALT